METQQRAQRVAAWCEARLGPGRLEPVTSSAGGQMSSLYRYSWRGGAAAVKVRADALERVNRCLDAQRRAATAGFPCALPLTRADCLATEAAGRELIVSAEEWRPGGVMMRGDDVEAARCSAQLLAQLMAALGGHPVKGFDPPPPWMDWNTPGKQLWPPNPLLDGMDQVRVPEELHLVAQRASARLVRSPLPLVVGHGDWEAQNIRWEGGRALAVHDWDSLVSLPEAAIVGAASGAFASTETPTLAPLRSSAAFLGSYEEARGRSLTGEENEVAWAASLWPALHNARGEFLFRSPPVAASALLEQANDRLRLAGA